MTPFAACKFCGAVPKTVVDENSTADLARHPHHETCPLAGMLFIGWSRTTPGLGR